MCMLIAVSTQITCMLIIRLITAMADGEDATCAYSVKHKHYLVCTDLERHSKRSNSKAAR